MAFVQIIEYRTQKADEMQRLAREWDIASKTHNKARRSVIGRDRNDPDRYLDIVFFDSHDEAMENSNHPITQEFAQKMMALADGGATFHDLDVVDDTTY